MTLCLIPARSGSKSIKNKNIASLAGKPLISYTIQTALSCKKFATIAVSTDSPKVAKIAKDYEIQIIDRPQNLASDSSPILLTIKHALSWYEKKHQIFDKIVILQPTSPFRKVKDFKRALELLDDPQVDSIVSVCETEHNPYFVMCSIENQYLKYPLFKSNKNISNRQEAPKVYRLNGSLYAIKTKAFNKHNSLITSSTNPLIMPWEYSIDIDNQADLLFAEFLLQSKTIIV